MDKTPENLAQTLARELPKPDIVLAQQGWSDEAHDAVAHVALPAGWTLKSIDNEPFLAGPRRLKAKAEFDDPGSFIDYVLKHHGHTTTVWCTFNPVSYALKFEAVIDEHGPGEARWRDHVCTFTPRMTPEWKEWVIEHAGALCALTQLGFAEFLERNERDIAGGDGFPSCLDMMRMAAAFEANADKTFKSKINVQSGGVEMQFVDTDDQATVSRMSVFSRFRIALPVFWRMPSATDDKTPAWTLVARLKYRVQQGAVSFWYELDRPDRVHEAAALALIEEIRTGLGGLGGVPLRMGSCRSS